MVFFIFKNFYFGFHLAIFLGFSKEIHVLPNGLQIFPELLPFLGMVSKHQSVGFLMLPSFFLYFLLWSTGLIIKQDFVCMLKPFTFLIGLYAKIILQLLKIQYH